MAQPEQLAQLACRGVTHQHWAVMVRGYTKAEKGGVFSPSKARDLAAYIIKLADEADARNGVELEGTSGVPYGEDTGATKAASL